MTSAATPTSERRIVVGIDGSAQSEAALRWALREPASEVSAVLVYPPDTLLPGTSYAVQPYGRAPATASEEHYAERLHATVAKVTADREEGSKITETVLRGDTATELINASADADQLVIGSHGARPVTELLLGSIATQCVRSAQCPVTVISTAAARRLDNGADPR